MSKAQILVAARSETLRSLARTSVTCMAYDAIADMVVKAARTLKPEIDELIVNDPPAEFFEQDAVISDRMDRPEFSIEVRDLVDDLWAEETMEAVIGGLASMCGTNAVLRHTIRGEIGRSMDNYYVLTISALAKHPDDE